MSSYGKSHTKIAELLRKELLELIDLKPDCIIICCNSLHKYYDMIKDRLNIMIPVFHAVDVVVEYIKAQQYHEILLLASKFTMEDGFFADKLEKNGIKVTVPDQKQRNEIQKIHDELLQGVVTEGSIKYFSDLIEGHKNLDAVVLGCTEFPLVVKDDVALPIIDPVYLQATSAIDFSLAGC